MGSDASEPDCGKPATCKNGRVFEGFYCVYTQALDNEPEIASLTLETKEGLVEIYENEVEAIEVLK